MDHLHYSLLNTYTEQPLDRSANERKNPVWLASQLADYRSEFLILNGHNIVTIDRVPLILSRKEFLALNIGANPQLLGIKKSDKTPVFLINITETEDSLVALFQDSVAANKTIASFSLREITREINSEIASMYSYATILNHWHITTRFCNRCGSPLVIKEGGSLQQCTNTNCLHIEYPRINPAVIMRVTKDDKILLSRQENWPENMYSVLAGFVEVGETLEQAVEREVMEETKLLVKNINYHSSQPWPFPNSMMLGYTADACSFDFELEQDDIEDAQWLTAEEMKVKIADGTLFPSSVFSISHSLINDWFQEQTGTSIMEFKTTLSNT